MHGALRWAGEELVPFSQRFPMAQQKLAADRELDCSEDTAAARRPRPPPDDVEPGRTLRDRFAAWLTTQGAKCEVEPPEFFDLNFFYSHKHLGERSGFSGTVALLCSKERLKSQLVRSAALISRTLSGEAVVKGLIDRLLSSTTTDAFGPVQAEILKDLSKRGVQLSSPYAFVTPLEDGADLAATASRADNWPCRLGLGIQRRRIPFAFLALPASSLEPSAPTAFDAGMSHLESVWIPGGLTKAENLCRRRRCRDGMREFLIRTPSLESILGVGELVSCVPHAV